MPEALESEDILGELLELVRDVRAHVEWHGAAGTIGLPRDPGAKARVESFWQENEPAAPSPKAAPAEASGGADRWGQAALAPAARGPSERPPAPRGFAPPVPDAVRTTPAQAAPTRKELRLAPSPKLAAEAFGSIEELQAKVRVCTACELHKGRTQTVFARGTGSSRVCFVGEGPGADEDAQGEPFVGAAGQLLDKMIGAMGLGRDEVYVCNIVKCRPPNNRKPEPSEMAACSGYLRAQLEFIDPEVIVALGGTAVSGLLGLTEGITRLRGTFRLYDGRIPVMPTFHPAYLLRTPTAKREVWADLKAVMAHLGR